MIWPKLQSAAHVSGLTDEEIDQFVSDLDLDHDGYVSVEEVTEKLKAVLKELAPEPQPHHLHYTTRWQVEEDATTSKSLKAGQGTLPSSSEFEGIQRFVYDLFSLHSDPVPNDDLRELIRSWNIPSRHRGGLDGELRQAEEYRRKLSLSRKLRAWWSLKGSTVIFTFFVGAVISFLGLSQAYRYLRDEEARAIFGWPVVVAKLFAGALSPTMFFMLLSMSRWLGNACRRFYYLSRIINWDRHQSFHISMACLSMFFATMHAIFHLTGTFPYASRPPQNQLLAHLLGSYDGSANYFSLLRSRPGWTGIISLVLFWTMALMASPWARKRNYEAFQGGHLLMFPLIGFLCAHGTAKLLQFPMLGFWLAPPTILVILERAHRFYRGFVRIPAIIKVVDNETVSVTCHNRNGKTWNYTAGQYILLQVPVLSLLQWHPFTVARCDGDILRLHIKTDGNWTRQLRSLPTMIEVGVDGPFGAPAQRFYEYDRSLIIGASTGITPFAAILSDLELKVLEEDDWLRDRSRGKSSSRSPSRQRSTYSLNHSSSDIALLNRGQSLSTFTSPSPSRPSSQMRSASFSPSMPSRSSSPMRSASLSPSGLGSFMSNDSTTALQATLKVPCSKRVDFHWIVREKKSLLWFSDLLNRAYDLSRTLPPGLLDLNIHTHLTLPRSSVSEHVFRYLLDTYRTVRNPVSALTGLKSRSHFGRPDFETILKSFHEDVRQEVKQGITAKGQKIAVFYCGGPALGTTLSDLCYQLTLQGRQDGSASRWDFRMEVFG